RQIFEHVLGTAYRCAEFVRGLMGDPDMIPGMGPDFVAGTDYGADQLRVPLGDPAHHEERCPRVVTREEVKQPFHAPADPGLQGRPAESGNQLLERGNLEVFFHIDGEVMPRHTSRGCNRHARCLCRTNPANCSARGEIALHRVDTSPQRRTGYDLSWHYLCNGAERLLQAWLMRFAVISDVHGNVEALRAVLRAIRRDGIRKIVCLGDLVGFHAFPVETLTLIR